jgi:ribosomal protein S18 acetylase RimI-like enzyme
VDTFVEEATETTPELVAAVTRLLPQLSTSSPPPTPEEVAEIVDSPATVLLVARLGGEGADEGEGGEIVGILTLAVFRIPTGVRSRIEDVVVDSSARGQGVGEALVLAALDRAYDAGARTVDLTSRPSRGSAGLLYERLGFERRDTNVYRHQHAP